MLLFHCIHFVFKVPVFVSGIGYVLYITRYWCIVPYFPNVFLVSGFEISTYLS
jgi:hypothetical protein